MLTWRTGIVVQEGETALHRTADRARGRGSVGNQFLAARSLIEHGGMELLLAANKVLPLTICWPSSDHTSSCKPAPTALDFRPTHRNVATSSRQSWTMIYYRNWAPTHLFTANRIGGAQGGETALHRAVVNDQAEMARLLADKGGPELLALEDSVRDHAHFHPRNHTHTHTHTNTHTHTHTHTHIAPRPQ